ncbi:MAG: hypothetical protein EBV41_05345 [Actinobacteria bacterium]|nr:hypothetical protein [Actinomycetota bacterium]
MAVQLPVGISDRLLSLRLRRCTATLRELRDDLQITMAQLDVVNDDTTDAELRALVSETPLADAHLRESKAHSTALGRHVAHLEERIAQLEQEQNDLLDRLHGNAAS